MKLAAFALGGILAFTGCAAATPEAGGGASGSPSDTGGTSDSAGSSGTGGSADSSGAGGSAGLSVGGATSGSSNSGGSGGAVAGTGGAGFGGAAAGTSSTGGSGGAGGSTAGSEVKRPDDKPADQTKKVKVFILMGQSNMVGMGEIEPMGTAGTLTTLTKADKKYPFLLDDAGQWAVRKDVYYYDARTKRGAPLSATANGSAAGLKTVGPELGFGFVLGQLFDDPVLVLKSCIGNRSLGWDLLPPGSQQFKMEVAGPGGTKVTRIYAGYKDTPEWWVEGEPKKIVNWYAGKQYDEDQANAKAALADLAKIYPDYQGQGYEIAGFVWWQGHKDHLDAVYPDRYEQNLARLVAALRQDYAAPNAKFALATGCGNPGLVGPGLKIAEAQLAVGDAKKYPAHAGNVKTIDSRDLWREAAVSPANQGYHYNRNAETYVEVGLRLGWAMGELLGK